MKPLKPKIKQILFAAVCLILGIGIGLLLAPAVLSGQMDDTVSERVQQEQPKPADREIPEHQTVSSETVYWTPNGKVYHLYRSCPSLNHSNVIETGTIEESGKPRVCHNCKYQ